jgi:hypothetical protein
MMRKSAGARIGSSVPTSRHLRLRLCEVGIYFSSHCRVGIVPPAVRRLASVNGTWPFAFCKVNTLISHIEVKKKTQIVTGIGALSQREAGARLDEGCPRGSTGNFSGGLLYLKRKPARSQSEAGASTGGA